jgi:hypothetical protein
VAAQLLWAVTYSAVQPRVVSGTVGHPEVMPSFNPSVGAKSPSRELAFA